LIYLNKNAIFSPAMHMCIRSGIQFKHSDLDYQINHTISDYQAVIQFEGEAY
jgi:hypothetical protein